MGNRFLTPEQKLEALINKCEFTETGCILWNGYKNAHGYGVLGFNKTHGLAHRFFFKMFVRDIPRGMCVCHFCDIRNCVAPEHLFLATHSDNMLDLKIKGNRKNMLMGENNPATKLNWKLVKEIRNFREKTGFGYRRIANHFKITYSSAERIVRNKTWKEIGHEQIRKYK